VSVLKGININMLLILAAVLGVGVWLWGLVMGTSGNGTVTSEGTTTLTSSTGSTASDEHYGGASTGFGGVVNWVQDVTNSDGMGSAAIDFLQDRWS